VDHFIDVLAGDGELRVQKKDATLATIVSEAALQSAKRGNANPRHFNANSRNFNAIFTRLTPIHAILRGTGPDFL